MGSSGSQGKIHPGKLIIDFGGADGEEAMKNLEAAQVQMEQKLKIMTGFIDKELKNENEKQVCINYLSLVQLGPRSKSKS